MKKTGKKGQIFSLDFIFAMVLTVLAIGMILNFYETSAMQEKEGRIKTELNAIALNASNLMLETSKCDIDSAFASQGYELFGCANSGKFSAKTKKELMIPSEFNCYITLEGLTVSSPECQTTDDSWNAQDVASVERTFMDYSGTISKTDYEKCIEGTGCTLTLTEKILMVKIWRGN